MQRPGQCGHNLAIVRDCYGHIAIAAVRAVQHSQLPGPGQHRRGGPRAGIEAQINSLAEKNVTERRNEEELLFDTFISVPGG